MEKTTVKEKKLYRFRDWEYLNKCPYCRGELEDKGLVTIFQDIWEHEIWLKVCKDCDMRIWTNNGHEGFIPETWQIEQCKDYDDPSWQDRGLDYGPLNRISGGKKL